MDPIKAQEDELKRQQAEVTDSPPVKPPAEETPFAEVTPLSKYVKEIGLPRYKFDIEGASSDGLSAGDMVKGILAQPDTDPRWRDFISSAQQEGFNSDQLLAELTGANPSAMEAVKTMGGRGAGRAAGATGGAIAGGKAGFALTGGNPLGGVAGAAVGALTGYFAADETIKSALGEMEQFTPGARRFGVPAETFAEVASTAVAWTRMLPKVGKVVERIAEGAGRERAAAKGLPFVSQRDVQLNKIEKFLVGSGRQASTKTGRAVLAAETLGATAGAGVAQSIAPENPWVRMLAEIGGGVSSVTGGILVRGAVDNLTVWAKRMSDTDDALKDSAITLMLTKRILDDPNMSITEVDLLKMSAAERRELLTTGAESMLKELRDNVKLLKEAGATPAAIAAMPELRLFANALGRVSPKFKDKMNNLDAENLDALTVYARALAGSGDEDAMKAGLLMRDSLNELQIEELIDANLQTVDRFIARATLNGTLKPTEIAERAAKLTRASLEKAKETAMKQAKILYDKVNKRQAIFAPTLLKKYLSFVGDPTTLSTDVSGLGAAARQTPRRALADAELLQVKDYDTLEKIMSSPDKLDVGELMAFKREMGKYARIAGSNPNTKNQARIYRELEQAAQKDLQNQFRIKGWTQYRENVSGAEGVIRDADGNEIKGLPGYRFRTGEPIVERFKDDAFEAANSFYAAYSKTFKRNFVRKALAKDSTNAYRIPEESLIDALLPDSPVAREARFNQLQDAAEFMSRQVRVLESKGIGRASLLDDPDAPVSDASAWLRSSGRVTGSVDSVTDLTLSYIARQAVEEAPDGTLVANPAKLKNMLSKFPEFFERAPEEVMDLFRNARVATVALNARRTGTPAARAAAAEDEFAELMGVLLEREIIGGKAGTSIDIRKGSGQEALAVLLDSSNQPAKQFNDLVRMTMKGFDAGSVDALKQAGKSTVSTEDFQRGMLVSLRNYVMSGDTGAVFSTARQRLFDPLRNSKESVMDILVKNGLLTPGRRRNVEKVLRESERLEEISLLRGRGEDMSPEDATKLQEFPELAVRILGANMGSLIARTMGGAVGGSGGGGLIPAAAGSRMLMRIFQNSPLIETKNVIGRLLLDPEFDQELVSFMAKQKDAPDVKSVVDAMNIVGKMLFGPRPTTAQLRLLHAELNENEVAAPEVPDTSRASASGQLQRPSEQAQSFVPIGQDPAIPAGQMNNPLNPRQPQTSPFANTNPQVLRLQPDEREVSALGKVRLLPNQMQALQQVSQGDPIKQAFMETVLKVENRGHAQVRNTAISRAGAEGAFQIMPGTAQALGLRPADRRDFNKSAEAISKLYDDMHRRHGGDLIAMLADYNGSPRAAALVKSGDIGRLASETRRYIAMGKFLLEQKLKVGQRPPTRGRTTTGGPQPAPVPIPESSLSFAQFFPQQGQEQQSGGGGESSMSQNAATMLFPNDPLMGIQAALPGRQE